MMKEYEIELFVKGIMVQDSKEDIPDGGFTAADAFIVYQGLLRKDFGLTLVADTIDHINLMMPSDPWECLYSVDPDPPTPPSISDWNTYIDNFPEIIPVTADGLKCDQVFLCLCNAESGSCCFCPNSQMCLNATCNHDILLVRYATLTSDEWWDIEIPNEQPIRAILACPVAGNTPGTVKPSINSPAQEDWEEDRNSVNMDILMDGEWLLDEQGQPYFQCPSGWHLNFNWQRCADIECCNCRTDGFFTISYSTLEMYFNDTQSLSVPPPGGFWKEACEITWSLSGGGSLNTTTGDTVIYTAPSSNPNCENNAVITATCSPNGDTDTIEIYIKGSGIGPITAYIFSEEYSDRCTCTPPFQTKRSCKCTETAINCDGDIKYSEENHPCIISCPNGGYITRDNHTCSSKYCPPYGWQFASETMCRREEGGWSVQASCDRRTEVMLSQGCCPDVREYE